MQVQSSNPGPKFTLALLVLLGLCALIGVTWLLCRLFRICKPQRTHHRPPSATVSGGLTPHPRDGSWHHRSFASLSTPLSDLERNDTSDSLTVVERTDSMVMRASAWARSILSGEQTTPVRPSPLTRQPSSLSSKNNKHWDTVSIPVKQAIVIMQPDGEATLGISEAKQKDVMVQVDEEDLLRESNNLNFNNNIVVGGNGSSASVAPGSSMSSHRRHQDRHIHSQRSRDLVDEASQCPGQYSRESSRSQLAGAGDDDEVNSNGARGLSVAAPRSTGEVDTRDIFGVESHASGSRTLTNNEQQTQEQVQQQQRHQRRRRRKRRKGTCEASCQTEESSLK